MSDFTINMISWSLNLERQRASVAANNIQLANQGGIKQKGNFDELLKVAAKEMENVNKLSTKNIINMKATISETGSDSLFGAVALDNEVLELSHAKGRYKTIAEALSRKYALMEIASKGSK
ncbi:hypothetical protein [Teredinibacter sp. KSP-S5-2]|uniref:hypothetical protein n=1 Tax=Teredinibacter sp. KSP-S5-2 TaxID=3034506 RepID=UPI0029346131|nr:hypothetical protein [Teredinibacter sp. KSP-S5-2]WNO11343.1 hypothetical protein P5V12_09180 [Teredinibacter sp. KSP-S5-2]